jgi:outer membrane biosynthesis protein TonB
MAELLEKAHKLVAVGWQYPVLALVVCWHCVAELVSWLTGPGGIILVALCFDFMMIAPIAYAVQRWRDRKAHPAAQDHAKSSAVDTSEDTSGTAEVGLGRASEPVAAKPEAALVVPTEEAKPAEAAAPAVEEAKPAEVPEAAAEEAKPLAALAAPTEDAMLAAALTALDRRRPSEATASEATASPRAPDDLQDEGPAATVASSTIARCPRAGFL